MTKALFPDSAQGPARSCRVITASDVTVYDPPLKAIRATGAGTITIVDFNDVSTAHPVLDGERIDVFIKKVMATGTSGVTGIIGYA
jgi:hypothetical protein